MGSVILAVACGFVGAAVSRRAAMYIAAGAGPTRANYRGIALPSAAGFAVVLGFLAGAALPAVIRAFTQASASITTTAGISVSCVAGVLGFALLGLWDDLAGSAGERGWRAHARALGRGRPSSGAIKLGGGIALALLVAAPMGRGTLWTLVDAAVVAMAANLWNLFDLRPGRACKIFVVAAIPLMVVAGTATPLLAAGLGAVVAFLPFDLRERTMLGDVGANALGALVGWVTVLSGSPTARVSALSALALMHLVADRPGLSRIISAVPPLRAFDLTGRVREP
ncbi:MAG: hypothetical protein WDA27_00540 [Actinomycetota bacterium]